MIKINPENRITINELTQIKEYINNVLNSQNLIHIDF